MRVKNTIIFLVIFSVFLWLFLSKSDPTDSNNEITKSAAENVQGTQEQLSSSIEPIKIIEVASSIVQEELDDKDRLDAQQQFDRATEYVLKREWQEAENLYLDLIEKLPLAIEPYINLAVVYAETDRLDPARQVLLRGVKANPNYAVLFDNLQSIHGSLAAKAYRAALIADNEANVVNQDEPINLDLPLINSMDLRLVDLNRQQVLAKQVGDMQKTLNLEQSQQENSQARIAQLEQELAAVNTQVAAFDESKLRVVALESQIKQQADVFASSEQELVAANMQIASLDESKLRIAALEAQIKQQSEAFASSEQALVATNEAMSVELLAIQKIPIETGIVSANVNEEIVVAVVTNEVEDTGNSQEVVSDNRQNEQDDVGSAFKLVENWASYWSGQDVSGYVSQYANNYSPPRSELSHRQWLEQRKVRLTNKQFIQVDVSDFEYDERDGNKFSVTFTQRYRSNTIDDTIRKRLVYANNGSSLLDAKIVDEIIVSN